MPEVNLMSTNEVTISSKKSFKSFLGKVVHNQLFIPFVALLLLVLFNLAADWFLHADTSFFEIVLKPSSTGSKILSGNLITIIDNASELALLAVGMTLVTSAAGGQDISVGATIAIAGSTVLRIVKGYAPDISGGKFAVVMICSFLLCVVVSAAFGAFNGMLVAVFKIQPIVATLILFTAGRSIAAWINNNDNISINDERFGYFGNFIPGIPVPTPVFITAICLVIIAALFTYQLTLETGAMEDIKQMLAGISKDGRIMVLIVGWAFGHFMEGMAGFGTAVAIPAGILVALGFDPFRSQRHADCLRIRGSPDGHARHCDRY